MQKVFQFGKIDLDGTGKKVLVELEVNLKDGENGPIFSASGDVWNNRKTDVKMCGQCIDTVYNDFKDQLQNLPLYEKIMGLWQRNHLNDLNAGTPEQMKFIEELEATGWKYEYSAACERLKQAKLYEVPHPLTGEPYKYGHGWIYREISPEDLQEIKNILA